MLGANEAFDALVVCTKEIFEVNSRIMCANTVVTYVLLFCHIQSIDKPTIRQLGMDSLADELDLQLGSNLGSGDVSCQHPFGEVLADTSYINLEMFHGLLASSITQLVRSKKKVRFTDPAFHLVPSTPVLVEHSGNIPKRGSK